MRNRQLADRIFKRLFEDSFIEGIRFGSIPQILFVARDSQIQSIYGQRYLNLASSWDILDFKPSDLPNNKDDLPELSEEEEIRKISSLRNIKVTKAEIGNKHPHLLFTFENNKILLVNGLNDGYEAWQLGVALNPKEPCQLIACPDGEIAIWEPKTFEY
jgi:hypothetical protein